jgi:hypothetical protein
MRPVGCTDPELDLEFALRCPRPRSEANGTNAHMWRRGLTVPSPDASLGDGDGAAHRPYHECCRFAA